MAEQTEEFFKANNQQRISPDMVSGPFKANKAWGAMGVAVERVTKRRLLEKNRHDIKELEAED